MSQKGSVHEPEAELLTAEDAIEDSMRLRAWLRQRKEPVVSLQVPLWALLDAIDHLPPDELRQVARRADERLVAEGSV